MPVEQRVKAILKSAELSFELGIINATRYGPLIHANVPDYAEILLRVFVEENKLKPRRFFNTLADEVDNYFLANRLPDRPGYRAIVDYFVNTRESFRNHLHHTDRVQGYVIEAREALLCLIKFDDLLTTIFPIVSPIYLDDLTYPCYVRYIRLLYEDYLGRNHRLFQAVNAALRRLEEQDRYVCPHEHDVSRLMAVRRLFRLPNDAFTITVLNYRPQLRDRLIAILEQTRRRMTPRQLKNALAGDPDLANAREDEIEACLQYIEGETMPGRGVVLIANMQYYLAPL